MGYEPLTLQEAILHFSNPDNCLAYMVARRWPDGVVSCPTCGKVNPKYIPERKVWQCSIKHPKRQFSVKLGLSDPTGKVVACRVASRQLQKWNQ